MPEAGDVLLVLAGGRSSRFGADKACAPFGPEGEALALRALRRLAPLGERRALVRAEPLAGLAADVTRVADPAPGAGPLQALLAAFAALPAARWFTAPCDAPWLEPGIYRELERALDGAPAAFARTPAGDEPLVAIWTPEALRRLGEGWAQGGGGAGRPVHAALARAGARPVRFAGAAPFANVNTQAELALARAGAEEER